RDFGPTGIIRVDITGIADAHSLYLSNERSDGGLIEPNLTDGVNVRRPTIDGGGFFFPNPFDGGFNNGGPRPAPYINLIHDPLNPFNSEATIFVTNVGSTTAGTPGFSNSGAGARWFPIDDVVEGSTDQHRVFAFRDPLTGLSRIIF